MAKRSSLSRSVGEMPKDVRKDVGFVAQDAFHHLVQAGGRKAERKYGESAFTAHDSQKLSKRIAALTAGMEKLAEVVELCQPFFAKQIPFPFHYVDPETEAELVRRAIQGLVMLTNLCKRFGVMPAEGITIEQKDW